MKKIVLVIILLGNYVLHAQVKPVELTCEFQENPLVVETPNPRFGWKLLSDLQGDKQTAYQIIVSSEKAAKSGDVWNSGKIRSDKSQLVDYKGRSLEKGQKYVWKVIVWDAKGKQVESDQAFFYVTPDLSTSKARWIGAISREKANLPIGRRDFHGPSFKKQEYKDIYDTIDTLALKSIQLRKSFNTGKTVDKAIAYVSGLGHYHFYLNGKKVNNSAFTPVWSDYDKSVYYNAYLVDTLLLKGENSIGVVLGNGFYNAVGNRYRKLWVTFGPPTLLFEMHVHYTDGSRDVIVSDDSWKYSLSPVTFNDIFGGEDYDARLEQLGWDKPSFNDVSWKPVVLQQAPEGLLRAQQIPAIRNMQEFGVKKMTCVEDGVYVLDMGQNLSGYPAIKVKGKKGQGIKLIVGELLDENGRVSQKRTGGPHTYHYTLKGEGIEYWHPQFTYYGFQYIQVEGADLLSSKDDSERPLLIDIKSHFVYNSVKETGNFECSNEIFSKTHVLIKNAVKSNMQSVFTDCPHREKLGWLEETHLNGPGLLYNYDQRQMFRKVMQDIADGQRPDGLVPSIVPEYVIFGDDFSDSPEWGSASVIVPWMYYKFYGDNALLSDYYDVMKRYVDYLGTKADNFILSHGLGDWYDYGDHPAGWSKNSPIEVSATSHYYYSAHLFAKAAEMLNKKDDIKIYTQLAADIKNAFNKKFFNESTKQYANGSQFSNAVAIFMDIVEPENKNTVMKNLLEAIRQKGFRLTTGDVGNRYLFQALALNGENEIMYKLNNHEDTPGYGFQLKFGVTTLTEQWDPRKGNSWNHFMMGQIDEWFFRSLAGIDAIEPGFKKFRIAPEIPGDLEWVKAEYNCIYGTIKVDWKRESDRFLMEVYVPVNTSAVIYLPDGKKQVVGSGNHRIECKI